MIKPMPSSSEDGLPGLGHPIWEINLQKIRNGRPQSWIVEFRNGKFREVTQQTPAIILHPTRKTG
jgi:protein ImuA